MSFASDPARGSTVRPRDAVESSFRASVAGAEHVETDPVPHVLAVAIEPGRLAAGLVDARGEVLLRDRVSTPARDVWRALERLIRRVIAASPAGLAKPQAVGVSCSGPIDVVAGSVSPPMVPAWTSFPLREHLERLTGRSVVLDTAGGAATEAERWIGEARGIRDYLVVRLDTTTESGCVMNGIRLAGSHGNAGSLAHIVVEPGGRPCHCGALGCLDAYVSSTSIEAETNRPLARATSSMIERTGIMLGRAIVSACATIDVQTVFVSGHVVDVLGDPMLDAMRREIESRARLASLAGLRVIEPHERISALVAAAALALG